MLWATDDADEVTRGFQVAILDDNTLQVDNFVINDGDMLYAAGMWGLTCTVPGPTTQYVVPLGDGSSWDTATITLFRTWAGHGQGVFKDEQFTVEDDAYVLRPAGKDNKRMMMTNAGVIAMVDSERDFTFAIETEHQPGATYPGNANLALYNARRNLMVEMETMGPLAQLKPDQSLHHSEVWTLLDHAVEPTGEAVMSALHGNTGEEA